MQAIHVRGPKPPVHPSAATITGDAEGRTVVPGDDTVGIVTEVNCGNAFVELEPGLTGELRAELGWSDDEYAFPLQEAAIDEVTDDVIRPQTDR